MENFTHKIMQGCGIRILPILIFLSLLMIAEPALSDLTSCKRYNYPIADIIVNGNRSRMCLIGTKYNQHGAIYEIAIPHTSHGMTIYRGKSGDAILETTVFDRLRTYQVKDYGSWRRSGKEFYFQFSSGTKIYIPAF